MIANHDICSSFNDLNKLTNTVKHHFREHLLIISPLQLPYIIFIPCPSNRQYMNLSDEKNHIHRELFMNLFDKTFIKNRFWHCFITVFYCIWYRCLPFSWLLWPMCPSQTVSSCHVQTSLWSEAATFRHKLKTIQTKEWYSK